MNYLTSFYWTEGIPNTSLTLQQATRKRGKMPVVLACVCEEDAMTREQGLGEHFCIQLTDWFYERALEQCSRGKEPDLSVLREELTELASDAGFSAAGILCTGERFLLFYRGRQRICLLNSRFLRPNIKELSANTDRVSALVVEEGILQSKVGVLLGTENFYRGISGEEIRNCLKVDAICDEKRVNRRLLELGHFGESRASGSRAAVLVISY